MHEYSITKEIITIVLENIKQGDTVRCVNVKIGRMSTFVPESIKFYFDIMKEETILKHSRINFDIVEAVAKCKKCGHQFKIERVFDFQCPSCKTLQVDMISGEELMVESVDVE